MNTVLYGVAINDSVTPVARRSDSWTCPFYEKWKSMLQRCYDTKKYAALQPTYAGCTVCEEWLTFTNFKNWMMNQRWEGCHLDKDLLVDGNKVYSPATCLFVPQEINKLFKDSAHHNPDLPIGVCYDKRRKKYRTTVYSDGKQKHIGYFSEIEEASRQYKIHKNEIIDKILAKTTDVRLAEALRRKRYEV